MEDKEKEYKEIPESLLKFNKRDDGTYAVGLKYLDELHPIKWDGENERKEVARLGELLKELPEYAIIKSQYGDRKVASVFGFEGLYSSHVHVLYDYDSYIQREYGSSFPKPFPSLKGIRLEEGIRYVDYEAFSYCKDLEEVSFPSTIEKIDKYAFKECPVDLGHLPEGLLVFEGLDAPATKELFIPAKVASIKGECLRRFHAVHIDPNNPYYECVDGVIYEKATKKAIYFADEKVREVHIKEGTETIGESCFEGWSGLQKVVFPSSVKRIEKNAFAWCKFLEEVLLNEGLLYVGDCAFYCCDSLREIVVPASVIKATYHAFGRNKNLVVKCKAASHPEGFASDFAEASKEVLWGQ